MKPERTVSVVPSSCRKLQDRIDELKWALSAKRILPSLPKGNARAELSEEIENLIGTRAEDPKPDVEVKTSTWSPRTGPLGNLFNKLERLNRKVEDYYNLAAPGPNDSLLHEQDAYEVNKTLGSIRSLILQFQGE